MLNLEDIKKSYIFVDFFRENLEKVYYGNSLNLNFGRVFPYLRELP